MRRDEPWFAPQLTNLRGPDQLPLRNIFLSLTEYLRRYFASNIGHCGGVAAALRQLRPKMAIFGVEPEGANTMTMSIAQGGVIQREQVKSIADSLCPPRTEPFSFSVCNALLDEIVLIDDEALLRAMALILSDLKLVVEPAAAASLAALCGPLRDRLAGKRVGTLCCGTNIASEDYLALMANSMNTSH